MVIVGGALLFLLVASHYPSNHPIGYNRPVRRDHYPYNHHTARYLALGAITLSCDSSDRTRTSISHSCNCKRGLIAEVKPLLDALVNEAGFWVAEPLYNSVLGLVNEI